MRLILLGAPGSGKGSIADMIQQKYNFPKISTGDLLREAVKRQTEIGIKASAQLGKGKLVDDDIVIALLKERLSQDDCRQGYILDGFPRNVSQAVNLKVINEQKNEIVFFIETSEEVVIKRIMSRLTCSSCGAIYNIYTKPPKNNLVCDVCGGQVGQRQDDKPEVISERIRTYHKDTLPLVAFYESSGHFYRIDGNGTRDEVFAQIEHVLDKAMFRKGPVKDQDSL